MILNKTFISHVRKNYKGNLEIQSNEDHSIGVSNLIIKFTNSSDFGNWALIMGMLHDKGKEQQLFQTRIKRASGIETGKIPEVEHAYVGALLAEKYFPATYPMVSWAIMCHHTGLYDYTYFEKKLHNMVIPKNISCDLKINSDFPDLLKKISSEGENSFYCWNHIQRVVFSCLVDADYLDTERFMMPRISKLRTSKNTLKDLLPELEKKLNSFHANTKVNKIRKEILDQCNSKSECEKGFYSMTVPTGGGKTLTSLLWAMKHAIYNGQQRIIVAIPYTSIITQTAAIFREIFGNENVLEHHSDVDLEENNEENIKLKLATENWDYPIIVTTNVQLFESLYSNRTSKCRKLHNICNSVIILDEVQTLQTDFLQSIIDALKAYNKCFNTSVLFTTASMPVLSKDAIKINGLNGIDSIQELIPENMNLQSRLKRVDIEFDRQQYSYDEISDRIMNEKRVLCIVNTRKIAREIFSRLHHGENEIYIHLSKNMCAIHLSRKIAEIKEALKNKDKIVRVISTQLIEAGVDIDFPIVYRQKAGLDSIIQAAGRCNREGILKKGITHVFTLKDNKDFGIIKQSRQAVENIKTNDYQSQQAMTDYFNQFYNNVGNFDKNKICRKLNNPKEMMFKTASEDFHLIDDDKKYNVIVNFENSEKLVRKLKKEGTSYNLMKKLGRYTVNIGENDFNGLYKNKELEKINDMNLFYLPDKNRYDDNIGLITEDILDNNILIK